MKRSIILLITCSLAFGLSLRADQNNNNKKKKGNGQQQQGAATVNQPQTHPKGQGQHQGQHVQNQGGTGQGQGQGQGGKHHNKAGNANGTVNTNANVHTNKNVNTNKLTKTQLHNSPQFKAKQLHAQQIHQQHVNFKAVQNSNIQSVQFNQNYKIVGANNWHGSNYVVFQNYHPIWHDQGWWHQHHTNIVLVGGGWYYWNAGYWFPAWGYDPGAAYYPYDGPIYAGRTPTPPDQVIADVQSNLQEQGYYKGEVDGLLGPLTRAALADYQRDNNLEITSAMDEPTLDSLGMS